MTSVAPLFRVAVDHDTTGDRFGPIADLLGTWVGTGNGWNVIAVPDATTTFVPEAVRYNETLTFATAATQVPNKGGTAGEQFNQAITYSLAVSSVDGAVPLHVEDGMWLFMDHTEHPIARQAIVPHGNAVLLVGTWTSTDGAPAIPDLDATPLTKVAGKPPEPVTDATYLQSYHDLATTFPDVLHPNATLTETIASQAITRTVAFDLSTDPDGGIANTPFITANADATSMSMQLWLEWVDDGAGNTFQQLQYSQVTMLDFAGILWPHVNVNTLRKFS